MTDKSDQKSEHNQEAKGASIDNKESASDKGKRLEIKTKPFPWPLGLVILTVVGVCGLCIWQWHQADYLNLVRWAWISICSILPVFALISAIGALAQILRRPVYSALTLILSSGVLSGCYWLFQKIVQTQWME